MVKFALCFIVLFSCTNEKAIKTTFFQKRPSWFLLEEGTLIPIASFQSSQVNTWKPRFRAAFVTGLSLFPGLSHTVCLAVSRLGLMVLSDQAKVLSIRTPSSSVDLSSYQTGEVFVWNQKLFFHMYQEPPVELVSDSPSVSLAWWTLEKSHLTFYPVPGQVSDPLRQAVAVKPYKEEVDFLWKRLLGDNWVWSASRLHLSQGRETALTVKDWDRPEKHSPLPSRVLALKDQLALKLNEDLGSKVWICPESGTSYLATWGKNKGPLMLIAALGKHALLVTENGFAAVQYGEKSQLYRLPDLSPAGKYTKAAALDNGFLIVWELSFRGYVGPCGILYLPYALFRQ